MFRLLYHREVVEDDLPRIPRNIRSRIAAAIVSRLTEAPERFGSPLRGTLRGYWKLRVGDYRVVYRVAAEEVWILAIRHRRTVYSDAEPRT